MELKILSILPDYLGFCKYFFSVQYMQIIGLYASVAFEVKYKTCANKRQQVTVVYDTHSKQLESFVFLDRHIKREIKIENGKRNRKKISRFYLFFVYSLSVSGCVTINIF